MDRQVQRDRTLADHNWIWPWVCNWANIGVLEVHSMMGYSCVSHADEASRSGLATRSK